MDEAVCGLYGKEVKLHRQGYRRTDMGRRRSDNTTCEPVYLHESHAVTASRKLYKSQSIYPMPILTRAA